MKKQTISSMADAEVDMLIERIPFLKELKLSDYGQYNLLLAHSKLLILDRGEVLLKKGGHGKKIYFLARGRLDVFSEVNPGDLAHNQITTGEIIAALSVINDQPRTATLAASTAFTTDKTQVIATDFRIFGNLHDYSNITLKTKINLLRLVTNNIRFKLSTFQSKYPDHRLVKNHHAVGRFSGEMDSEEELDNLSGQAFVLTHLLECWNKETDAILEVPKIEVNVSTKDRILGYFSKKA